MTEWGARTDHKPPDTLVERVARAIADATGYTYTDDELYLWNDEARAAIAVVIEEAVAYLKSINHTNTAELLRRALGSEAPTKLAKE